GTTCEQYSDRKSDESDLINLRLHYKANPILRNEINDGHVSYIDQHLSQTSESLRQGVIGPSDYAVVEAAAITEDGLIIPSRSIGNSPIFVQQGKHVIIEVNLNLPKEYEGLHDIYIPEVQGNRHEIPLHNPSDRIGEKGIRVDPAKVRGVILSRQEDS